MMIKFSLASVTLILMTSSLLRAQISKDFYKKYGPHAVAQPLRPSAGIQLFDFTIASPDRFGGFYDFKTRLLSDVLNIKRAPYSTNEANFIGGWLEMRFGFNIISRDKFNTAIGVSPLNIWSIIGKRAANARAYVMTGLFVKTDRQIGGDWMFRVLLSYDPVVLKSSGSNSERAALLLTSLEVVRRNGLFIGVDFIYAEYGPLQSPASENDTARRLELKAGYKLWGQ